MSKSVYPSLPEMKAYAAGPKLLRQRPSLKANWIVPCEFCGRIHLHGLGAGLRQCHCPPNNDYHAFEFEGRERPGQYVLVYAGIMDDAKAFEEADKARRRKYRAHVKAQNARRQAALAAVVQNFQASRHQIQKGPTTPPPTAQH